MPEECAGRIEHEPGEGEGERLILEYTDPIQNEVFRLVEEFNPNPELGITSDIVTYARPQMGDAWIDRGTGHASDIRYFIGDGSEQ